MSMHADAAKLIWDARQAVNRVTRFVDGKSFDDYLRDDLLRSAVERQFEIIGEAFSQLRRVDPHTAEAIRELPRVVAFRNILIHAYATGDSKLVWGVVESDLPMLRAQLDELSLGG